MEEAGIKWWDQPPKLELDNADSDHFTGTNDNCQYTDKRSGANFDLRPLVARRGHIIRGVTPADHDSAHAQQFHAEGHDYDEYKKKNFRSTGYDYVINVCQNVHKRPTECKDKPFAPAYQVAASDVYGTQHPPGCYVLGALEGWKFQLIDPTFPATGVDIVYSTGEDCMKSKEVVNSTGHTEVVWDDAKRSMTLRFLCDENENSDVESILRMARRLTTTEPEMCSYRVEWPSIYGCPLNNQNKWKRTEADVRTAAPSDGGAAPSQGFFGTIFSFFWSLFKYAFYLALLLIVIGVLANGYAHRLAIIQLKDQLLAFDMNVWKDVGLMLLPSSLTHVKNAVSSVVSGKGDARMV